MALSGALVIPGSCDSDADIAQGRFSKGAEAILLAVPRRDTMPLQPRQVMLLQMRGCLLPGRQALPFSRRRQVKEPTDGRFYSERGRNGDRNTALFLVQGAATAWCKCDA